MNYLTKTDIVYHYIKKRVLSTEWEQGKSININELKEALGVSAIPVREALKMLQSEGLVEIVPHNGARVITLDDQKVLETMVIRAVLEGYAARTAVHNMDCSKLEVLKNMIKDMERHAANGDVEEFGDSNKEFHRYLYKQCEYDLLYKMIFDIWDGGSWAKLIFTYNKGKMVQSINEHKEIVKAIEEKDEDKVEQLVRLHKQKIGELFLAKLHP